MLQVIYFAHWIDESERFLMTRWFLQNPGLAVRPLSPQPLQF